MANQEEHSSKITSHQDVQRVNELLMLGQQITNTIIMGDAVKMDGAGADISITLRHTAHPCEDRLAEMGNSTSYIRGRFMLVAVLKEINKQVRASGLEQFSIPPCPDFTGVEGDRRNE